MAHGYGVPVKDTTRIVNFAEAGHFPIWPKPHPMTPRVRDAIEKIGLRHRHEPEKKD